MNILPKKRWHVRTKDNIARVRKDEAEAQAEERKRQEKLQLAESEARINFLRRKSGLPEQQSNATETASDATASVENAEHFDLFSDYKSHIKTTNKELEKEKKEEQEKYEKQIGYLTYLGQDTNEALKLRSWYEVAPKRNEVGEREIVEKDLKTKFAHDPLTLINALLPPEKVAKKIPLKRTSPPKEDKTKSVIEERSGKRHKKEKKHKKDKKSHKHKKKSVHKERKGSRYERDEQERALKKEKLEKLRRERLRREAQEKERQAALLAPKTTEKKEPPAVATPRVVQKYNSQFNPELAKQNQL